MKSTPTYLEKLTAQARYMRMHSRYPDHDPVYCNLLRKINCIAKRTKKSVA